MWLMWVVVACFLLAGCLLVFSLIHFFYETEKEKAQTEELRKALAELEYEMLKEELEIRRETRKIEERMKKRL